jgi:hypothetical protein
MKKIALIIIVLLSVFYACKKEDKKTEPTPVSPSAPKTCTTCPYCLKDSVLADTLIHFKATVDSTFNFSASSLWDTIIGSGPTRTITIVGKNIFSIGNPELKINYVLNHYPNTNIGDSSFSANISYKINSIIFHSKKGLIRGPIIAITNQYHVDAFSMNFCFNTDTINGVSHKIKLGSVKIKHP